MDERGGGGGGGDMMVVVAAGWAGRGGKRLAMAGVDATETR
jgi:hypothetical protein